MTRRPFRYAASLARRAGRIATVLFSAVIAACGTASAVVADAKDEKRIAAIRVGCQTPYEFTQDCSMLLGPRRLVEIADIQFRIAGSEDGSIVRLSDANPTSDAWTGWSGAAANIAYELTKKLLLESGVAIRRAEAVVGTALYGVDGYIITTDGNAYEILSRKTVEE